MTSETHTSTETPVGAEVREPVRPARVNVSQEAAIERLRGAGYTVAFGFAGFVALFALWALAATAAPDLPTPAESLSALGTLLSSPFHDSGPNDKGIGIQMMTSLQRVFIGFGIATIVAVPIGFMMGASKAAWAMFNPVVQLLRPVSPLAWFPLGLVMLKA